MQRRLYWGVALSVIIVFATGATWLGMPLVWQQFEAMLISKQAENSGPWHVQVKLRGEVALAETSLKQVQKQVGERLRLGTREELESSLQALVKLGIFSDAAIKVTGDRTVVVTLSERQPFMRLAAWGDTYHVSSNGDVYLSNQDLAPPKYAVISEGLLSGEPAKLLPDKSLELNPERKERVRLTISLVESLTGLGLDVSKIWFEEFRGYHVAFANKPLQVSLGLPPFSLKLERLTKILDNFKGEHEQISEIELDYQGKAFIRKRG